MIKLGDYVEVTQDYDKAKEGMRGIVIDKLFDSIKYAVKFDENIGGHSCGDLCEYGYGQYVLNSHLKLISTQTITNPHATLQLTQNGITSTHKIGINTMDLDGNINIKLDLDKKEFIPYLSYGKNDRINFGTIGELTDQTAIFGEQLYVGDIVELYNTKYNENRGLKVIAKDDCCYFVMGLCGDRFVNGICSNYQIRKVKSYTEIGDGELIDDIKYNLKSVSDFVPHLINNHTKSHYGKIGEETDIRLYGTQICVGDLVKIKGKHTDKIATIVKYEDRYFVLGVAGIKFNTRGVSHDGNWTIEKVKSYSDITHNEIIDGIKYIKEEE